MTIAVPITRPALPEACLQRLSAIFGDRLSLNETIRDQHGHGEGHHAGEPPQAVVFPLTTEEVAEAVKACAAHGVAMIPFGSGTSLEGHLNALAGGVSFDLTRMDQIVEVNAEDLDCTVQAGVNRVQLNDYVRDQGLFFPIDPGAVATLGGMAATRASGTNAVRYGTMRENVLALTVVLPDGEVMRTRSRARKSSAGYDLTALFVGSEGTLGIITEVTLRLFGIPETITAATCCFDTMKGAADTVIQLIQLGVPVARVELLDSLSIRAINQATRGALPERTTLWFEFHGSAVAVADQVETAAAICADCGGEGFVFATDQGERNRMWKARHELYHSGLRLRPGSIGWATDVCVPISRLADCIVETRADLDTTEIPTLILGHVGDGNFHVMFVLDPDAPEELATAERLNGRLVERALAMQGTCTGEHGIGIGKMGALERELPGAVPVMRRLKRALDPANLMNPGKIVRL